MKILYVSILMPKLEYETGKIPFYDSELKIKNKLKTNT